MRVCWLVKWSGDERESDKLAERERGEEKPVPYSSNRGQYHSVAGS